jgi:hypothetical protein
MMLLSNGQYPLCRHRRGLTSWLALGLGLTMTLYAQILHVVVAMSMYCFVMLGITSIAYSYQMALATYF